MISKYSVRKTFTVLVAVVLVVVLGIVSVTKMVPDLLPEMSFPYIVLFTSYVGASPEEVEQTVTKPLEQSLASLDDLKEIQSTSGENFSTVFLTFDDAVNTDRAMLDIQQVVTQLKGGWPDTVGTPTMLELSTDLVPTVVAAVSYEGMDPVTLSSFVNDTLAPALEGTNGVASVSTTGMILERIEIQLSTEKIDALNEVLYGAIDKEAESAMEELDEARQKLIDGKAELEDAREKLKQGQSALNEGRGAADQAFDEAQTQLDDSKAQIETGIAQLEEGLLQLKIQKANAQQQMSLLRLLQASVDTLERNKTVVEASIEEINSDPTLSDTDRAAALEPLQQQLDTVNASLAAIDGQLADYGITHSEIGTAIETLENIDGTIATLEEQLAQAKAGLAAVEAGQDELDTQRDAALAQMNSAQRAINEGKAQLLTGEEELENGEKQLDDAVELAKEKLADAKNAADLHNILTKELASQLIQAHNFEMPAGYVKDGDTNWIVSVGNKVVGVEALENVPLIALGMDEIDVVRLKDVADVLVMDNRETTYARIDGQSGVLLSFTRAASYAQATVADNIKARFAELEEQYPGLHFVALMDQGDYIYMAMSSVVQSLLIGGALAILILFLFLRDIRPTLAVGISIPVSVLFALVLMYFSGVTMNIISMAGLAIGIGMLVDNSIVVIENIYRLRSEGVPAKEAAIQGAKEVMGAITASTLTTICVFLPILFVEEGMTKQIFMDMILTITYSLLASLIVALTVIPAAAQGLLRREVKPMGKVAKSLIGGLEKAVRFAVGHRVLTLLVALLLLGGSAFLSLRQGFIYFPESGGTQISVTVNLPDDYTFEQSCALADEMLASIETVPDISDIGGMIGGGVMSIIGLGGNSNNSTLTIYALIDEHSGRSSIDVTRDIKQALEPYADTVHYTVAGMSTMSMSSSLSSGGFSMNIYSNELDDLRVAADAVASRLAQVPGLIEVKGGSEDRMPALRITVDKEKAIQHNLTTAQVYMEIVKALTDTASASQITTDTTSLSATVISEERAADRQTLESMILTATLRDGTTEEVPLMDIVTVAETETLASISRGEQRRYVEVSGTVDEGYNVTLVSAEARRAVAEIDLPASCRVEFNGENETIMDAMKDLLMMLLLGILIIYLIMVAQFQSLLSPFIVILTVPLSFAGGFIGLLVTGNEMSIVSMIGMIMLVGIVVNNGIVLVDCANRLREEEGLGKREAVIRATTMRIRPVLMTALTTILGLIPLAIGMGTGAEIIQPVAIVCIGGLTYATLMTVFVVPVLYDLLRRDKKPTEQSAI